MTNKAEKKLDTLYASYRSERTAMAKGKVDSPVEPMLNPTAGEIDDEAKQVISLYRNFQRSRVPDKEQVIHGVMSMASLQQRHHEAKENSAASKVSLITRLQNFFSVDSAGGWQPPTAFFVAVRGAYVVSVSFI